MNVKVNPEEVARFADNLTERIVKEATKGGVEGVAIRKEDLYARVFPVILAHCLR